MGMHVHECVNMWTGSWSSWSGGDVTQVEMSLRLSFGLLQSVNGTSELIQKYSQILWIVR